MQNVLLSCPHNDRRVQPFGHGRGRREERQVVLRDVTGDSQVSGEVKDGDWAEGSKRGGTYLERCRVLCKTHVEDRPSDFDALKGDLRSRKLAFPLSQLVRCDRKDQQCQESRQRRRERVRDLYGDDATRPDPKRQ